VKGETFGKKKVMADSAWGRKRKARKVDDERVTLRKKRKIQGKKRKVGEG